MRRIVPSGNVFRCICLSALLFNCPGFTAAQKKPDAPAPSRPAPAAAPASRPAPSALRPNANSAPHPNAAPPRGGAPNNTTPRGGTNTNVAGGADRGGTNTTPARTGAVAGAKTPGTVNRPGGGKSVTTAAGHTTNFNSAGKRTSVETR